MAKETKMQREIRVEAERAAEQELNRKTYPNRLMDALSRALALGAEADVNATGMYFEVKFLDGGRVINVPYAYDTPMDEEYLQDLIYDVGILEFERDEARRLEQVRLTAMSKLSDEELKVLGLIKERDAFSRW